MADDLNPQQLEALKHLNGPVLILAGAGSGKTRVLTYRMAKLVEEGLCAPHQIWATTFTNKAAQEMRERVSNLLKTRGIGNGVPFVSTFHSSGAELLRRYGAVMGLSPHFSIYDDSDQLALIKRTMRELNIAEKQWNPKVFRQQINSQKNLGLDPLQYSRTASTYEREMIYRVYDLYQKRLREAQALDFGDLLMESVKLLRDHTEVRERIHQSYQYFHVDEFQDTNPIQYSFIRLLAEKSQNLCVVGDEDQSIYGWRGANIGNILNFNRDYPNVVMLKLERNYRSTRTIVTAASHVIAHNTERMNKTLFSEEELGSKIQIYNVNNEHEEADKVVQSIDQWNRQGRPLSEIAVFYRTHAQSRVLEERLRSFRIPYQIYGGLRFYDRAEIKDALSYLRLVVNPSDDVAFGRVVNMPPRGIGKSSIEKLLMEKTRTGETMLQVSEREGILSGKARRGILDFLELVGEMVHLTEQNRPPLEIFQHWWARSGYVEMLRQEDKVEADARIQNLGELENALQEYGSRVTSPTLSGFLEEVALLTDRPQDKATYDAASDAVKLMTLHSSKGLEFENVYMTGMEDGLFPSSQSFDDPHGVQEERRLFYVGMTRARERLQLYSARNRMSYGQLQAKIPSRFLDEIPAEFVSKIGFAPRTRFESEPSWSVRSRSMDDDAFQPSYDDLPEIPRVRSHHESESHSKFRKGMRVRHSEYGLGVIKNCDGLDDDLRIVVQFMNPGVGMKKFMAKYAQLEVFP